MKKYELTNGTITIGGRTLHRIKALRSFGDVEAGELGGFIEKEENLSHEGNAWVYGDADYATVGGFGSEYRTTTFFRQKDGSIGVRCGCFFGTLAEFREKVRETHKDTKYAEEYLMIADLMELHFKKEVQE